MNPAALIGRDHPAGVLRAEVERAVHSHGGLVLVTGEPGIGKTTLVSQIAREARESGALVLAGSCWASDSAPGYWPWVQVVRALRRAVGEERFAAAQETSGADSPWRLGALLGESPVPGADDPAAAFRLYDAVTTALVAVSHDQPVVVVLDDLHWADAASLKLLEFAAGHAWFERLLLVGTYRDAEVDAEDHPLRGQILPLVAKATTLSLAGLTRAETGALVARTAGREPDGPTLTELHRFTGGNPFFVEQSARLWAAGGSLGAVAPGVREAVRRRLDLLPAAAKELLTTGAVLGREFHRQVLAAVAAAPVAHVDRLLDQAVTARLMTALGNGRFAFAHDLVRETLQEELAPEEARARHAAVVGALEQAPDLAAKVFPADRARHAYAAGDAVLAETAVRLLQEAAHDAGARLALEEQVVHQRRAAERAVGLEDQGRRVLVTLGLAEFLHHAGEVAESRRAFDACLDLARSLDDATLLARVALTLYGRQLPGLFGTEGPSEADGLLREALRALVGGGAAARGGADPAQGRTAGELAQELSVRSAVLARRHEDDEALGFSLWARHHAIWGPGTAAERVALVEELTAIARRSGDAEGEHFARALHWVARIELGDPRYLDEYHAYVAHAEQSGQPMMGVGAAIDQSIVCALGGRFAQAESFLTEAFGYASRTEPHTHFFPLLEHHRWTLALLQGRYEGVDEVLRSLERGHPCARLLVGITAVERAAEPDAPSGELAAAETYARELLAGAETGPDADAARGAGAAGGPEPELPGRTADIDRGFLPLRLRFQAQAAAASGDRALCAAARAALVPYAEQWAVSMFGWDISGPVAHWIALCDAAMGRLEEAEQGFTKAYRSAELLAARPWSALARVHLAEVRAARGEDAEPLLAEVVRDAEELGMRQVLRRAARLRESAAARPAQSASGSATPPSPTGTERPGQAEGRLGQAEVLGQAEQAERTGRTQLPGQAEQPDRPGLGAAPGQAQLPAPAYEFRFDGTVWTLTYAGRTTPMPDAKGLRDLRQLLSRPGDDIPAVHLLAPEGGAEVVAARSLGGDAVLDEEAKRQYRARLERLDDEIDRAAARGDPDRAAEYDRERKALLEELRAAAGLGGRSRRLGDEAERARKTVTARIRDTLRRLDTRHPELAAHLRESVTTGVTCAYRPPGGRGPEWRL
ncbi:ATP-binding protein [Streptomyces sp. Da 82-17]|uniref:ATP-binding protein n=1 Tax=Streptomyces sp. Da 82-17 TaxID=3377116 RepID=UPI0038D39FAA